ncbi:pyrophosphatase [Rhizobium sp. DKSPLA3]|uniref:Pyrophosphatase n=1 Tax=Rhizobium quercicola TaxID=2901226 RepID=A0A9X1NXD2_9HYPH|nr:MazG nucleotide pyrophosphohydrolase domain-containing protein [Rhizobium quercicola]MCD7111614.1 pyrophosphatase [Rhizobium quercicola]
MLGKLQKDFERASVRYAETTGILRDDDWFILKLVEEMGEVTQAWNRLSGRARRKGLDEETLRTALEDETADLLGHVLLFAHRHGLDLDAAVERKWRFSPVGTDGTAP